MKAKEKKALGGKTVEEKARGVKVEGKKALNTKVVALDRGKRLAP